MKKQPTVQPSEQLPSKKRRIWPFVIGAILVMGIVGNLINPNSSRSVPSASPSPDGAERSVVSVVATSTPDTEPTLSPTVEPTPAATAAPTATPTPTLYSEPFPAVSSEAEESPVEDPVVYVWIPSSGSKYHSNAGCSNMNNPRQVTLDEAIAMGYDACKRCY